jgi:hypothetical protein
VGVTAIVWIGKMGYAKISQIPGRSQQAHFPNLGMLSKHDRPDSPLFEFVLL